MGLNFSSESTFCIQSIQNEKYLSIQKNGKVNFKGNVSKNEEFKVKMISENEYILISKYHGLYLSIFENEKLITSSSISKKEKIRIVIDKKRDNVYGFKFFNDSFLSIKMNDNQKDNDIVLTNLNFTENEKFKIISEKKENIFNQILEDNSIIGIKSLKYETYFNSNLNSQKNEIEYFKIERIKFNQIRIKNKYKKYLISTNENKLKFDSNLNNLIENQEMFEIIDCVNDKFAIKSIYSNSYLSFQLFNSILLQTFANQFVEKNLRTSPNNIIDIKTSSQFMDILQPNRNYYIITFVSIQKSQCPVCPYFKEIYSKLGKHYFQNDFNQQKSKIYFTYIEYSQQTHQIVGTFGIQHVPVLIFKPNENKPILLNDPVNNGLIEFILKETNIKITLNPNEIDPKRVFPSGAQGSGNNGGGSADNSQSLLIFTILSGIGIFIFILFLYSLITNWWNSKKIFGVISFVTYGACVGGSVFCVLNESSFFYPRGNSVIIFYPSFQHQTVIEGWLAGGVMILGGLSLIILHDLIPKMENGMFKKIFSTISIWLFWCCVITLVMFFTWKNAYYMSNTPIGPYLAVLRDLFGKAT
eukprot:gene2626-3823_t